MNKRVFLMHGGEGYPEEGGRPWLKQELEKKGFKVYVPAMPDTAKPTEEKWVSHLAKIVGKPDLNCHFVGHSLGCMTILRYLETLGEGQKVGGAILVAGFGNDLEYEAYKGELSSFFRTPIDWEKIKNRCKRFVAIRSDNDPWVSPKNTSLFRDKLGAEVIIEHNMKHFSGDDGITELPIVLEKLV